MKLTSEMVLRIDEILAAAQAQGRSTLYEHEVYGILQTIGLGVPRHRFVGDVAEVTAEVLVGVGHTVMVKVVSPGIPHKQKVGGVRRVAASDPLYVQFVLTRMREEVLSHFAPGEAPAITGFLLVEFVPHTQAIGYEVLVGFHEDAAFRFPCANSDLFPRRAEFDGVANEIFQHLVESVLVRVHQERAALQIQVGRDPLLCRVAGISLKHVARQFV